MRGDVIEPELRRQTAPDKPTTAGDPAHWIKNIPAATGGVTSARPDSSLEEVVTLMRMHRFSQVPIMTGRHTVKGVATWRRIGLDLAMGHRGNAIRHHMEEPWIVSEQTSMFEVIPTIAAHDYVLVRTPENAITGIVTSYDLDGQFQRLAEPFLLLREIEERFRQLVDLHFDLETIKRTIDPDEGGCREIACAADLTFGEYLRLVENEERWKSLGCGHDRATFCRYLNKVREIRNEVMHFDPRGISPREMAHLREFADFLRSMQRLATCNCGSH